LKKIFIILVILTGLCEFSHAQELRGAWISRNEIGTKAQIASVMDSLADNNFNVAYVNVWSRGYPLFPSETFKKETGMLIDPNYVGRDVLAEAIAEGHRRGIEVEAWFEYGFVGGWTGYNPGIGGKGKIFDTHPEWTAKKVDGTEIDASNFYWMTHTRPDVQKFLLGMIKEMAQKYDVDGIELDRVRYAGNAYGYDSYTDSVYRAEKGSAPPTTPGDAEWMRWRADILNRFMRAAYDTIKTYNQNVHVTNAPGHYSSSSYQAYNDNLQDWWQWVQTGSVDLVQVQMYVGDNFTLTSYLNYILANVSKKEKIFPALAVAPNGTQISNATLSQMVATTRSKGLGGNVWWYYGDINPVYWSFFRTQIYPTHAEIPGRPHGWRIPAQIVNETDSAAKVSPGWLIGTNFKGYQGNSFFATDTGAVKTIEYFIDVPYSGWYEVYAFQPTFGLRSTRVPFDVYDSVSTVKRVLVDQTNSKINGWHKLGDFYLQRGYRKVVRISNEGIETGRQVGADAVMICLNRKLSPSVLAGASIRNFTDPQPDNFWLGQNYPNPFNGITNYELRITNEERVNLKLYDVLGREVAVLADDVLQPGVYRIRWNASGFASGVYYCVMTAGNFRQIRSTILMK
jgi:uncharacterized lipoprotein YddW (UPF0748 family)